LAIAVFYQEKLKKSIVPKGWESCATSGRLSHTNVEYTVVYTV
jgi:hypothetical protein